MTSPKQR